MNFSLKKKKRLSIYTKMKFYIKPQPSNILIMKICKEGYCGVILNSIKIVVALTTLDQKDCTKNDGM